MIVGGPGGPYFSTANPTVCFSSSGEQNLRSYDLCQPRVRQTGSASARARVFKPYSSPSARVLSSLTRPSTARATSFCREHCSMLHVATQVPQPSFRVSRQDTCCRARHAEHRSTRRVVVRAYGRAPKALHRHQTALATDIESSRPTPPSWHASSLAKKDVPIYAATLPTSPS